MVTPDNFIYFLIIFSISVILGVVTVLSYKKNALIFINALMFFLCAARAVTEFIIHYVDQFELANEIAKYNSFIGQLFYTFSWSLLYYYIRPFKKHKYANSIDLFVGLFIIAIPCALILYLLNYRLLFVTNPLMLEGFWTYKRETSSFMSIYILYSYFIMGLFVLFLLSYSIYNEKAHRIRKTILGICLFIFFYVFTTGHPDFRESEWKLSFSSMYMLLECIILSWFISGYRLLKDQYKVASDELLNSVSDLIIRTDKQYNIIDMNQSSVSILGQAYSNIFEVLNLPGGQSKENLKGWTNKRDKKMNIEVIDKAGLKRIMLVKVSPYFWRSKDVGYSFLLTDVTELKHKENQLLASNNTKDQLFSIISHDLRKPALAFKGIATKVNYLINKRDFKSLDRLSNSIEQSATTLNSLLDNLLNWSLLKRDSISIRPSNVKLMRIVDEVIDVMHIALVEKSIEVDTSHVDESHELYTDPDIILTIIRNLVDNAIKYSYPGSTVYISSQILQEAILIKIKDTGVGMDSIQQKRISEIYQNKSKKGTAGERGSGIGLNLVYDLVNQTNGECSFISQVGKGTEVILKYKVE